MESVRGKRIYVGLSGGVDSAVTAALLKEKGALVTGVFIRGWYPPGMPCTWAADRRDAMRVAARLAIPFITLDASSEYKQGVIDYLLSEYAAGRTPNPDIMCNREVKFGAFARFARAGGAEHIATGHYARSEGGNLFRGIDPEKDQSYFLWAVPKESIAYALFPLGDLYKKETRALAKRFNLPNAQKKDSRGVCFLGSISVEDFLASEFGVTQGNAVDESGKILGTHSGALLYTLGERAPLLGADPGPWYVVRKDMQSNTITVSPERRAVAPSASISLSQTNVFVSPEEGEVYGAQYRYHGPRVEGTTTRDMKSFVPSGPLPEYAAPGQSLVIYSGDLVVGGGIMN